MRVQRREWSLLRCRSLVLRNGPPFRTLNRALSQSGCGGKADCYYRQSKAGRRCAGQPLRRILYPCSFRWWGSCGGERSVLEVWASRQHHTITTTTTKTTTITTTTTTTRRQSSSSNNNNSASGQQQRRRRSIFLATLIV